MALLACCTESSKTDDQECNVGAVPAYASHVDDETRGPFNSSAPAIPQSTMEPALPTEEPALQTTQPPLRKARKAQIQKQLTTSNRSNVLRGVPRRTALAGMGALLAPPRVGWTLTADNKLYGLSREVPQLGYFISHSWRDSRWQKYLALLCLLNLRVAFAISFSVFLLLTYGVRVGVVPLPTIRVSAVGHQAVLSRTALYI